MTSPDELAAIEARDRHYDIDRRNGEINYIAEDRRYLLAALHAEREARARVEADDAAMWVWLSSLRAEHVLARGSSHGLAGEDWIGGTCAVCRGLSALYKRKEAALAPDASEGEPK